MGVGGPEVELLAQALGAIAQPIKMFPWFRQNVWLPVLLIVIALALCLLIWHDDIARVVLNGGAAAFRSMQQYATLNKLGVLSAGTD